MNRFLALLDYFLPVKSWGLSVAWVKGQGIYASYELFVMSRALASDGPGCGSPGGTIS